jgi:HK97 family phage major capsid protein
VAYNTGITRSSTTGDPLVPTPVSNQIIQELPQASVMLNRARKVTMSALTYRQPVLASVPAAYWVSGDQGLKQTDLQTWANVVLQAEELAVLVPIPNAYIDDADVPIWDEVRPRLTAAIGKAFDEACLFGYNKPASWTSASIFDAATAAGNVVTSSADIGVGVADMGLQLAREGYGINGFAAAPGFLWNLTSYRTSQGLPIYNSNVDGTPGGNLYGYAMNEVMNGAWDPTKAALIAGDWDKAVVGVRQDITFDMSSDGVIADATGKVILSAYQQDSQIMRVVFRGAYALANPYTDLQPNAADRCPFSILSPVVALGGPSGS